MKVLSVDYNWGQYAAPVSCNEFQEASTGCEGTYTVGENGVINITLTTDEKEAQIEFSDKIIKQRNLNRIVFKK